MTSHGLFAREPYSTIGGMESHIPLLCCCDECGTIFIAFSQEFSLGRSNSSEYTKIYGYNRISAGNWLYFKGGVKPGRVKSYFQTADKEVIVLSYDGVTDDKVELEKVVVQQEVSPEGYKLVPAQTAQVLIGDRVFHAIRKQFGVAVGLVSEGGKDKLAILLDDNSLLFITEPPNAQNIPNNKLTEFVCNKLQQLFVNEYRKVTVTVGHGIVYIDGIVRDLATKRALCLCIRNMPHVRGCVNFLRVQMETYVSDDRLQASIYALLESPSVRVFDYTVEVLNSKAKVTVCCTSDRYPKDLEQRITTLPGLQDLSLQISSVGEISTESMALCTQLEKELSENSHLAGSLIRVSFYDNKFLLEGRVTNAFQKQWAFISVVKSVKTASIENKLRIC